MCAGRDNASLGSCSFWAGDGFERGGGSSSALGGGGVGLACCCRGEDDGGRRCSKDCVVLWMMRAGSGRGVIRDGLKERWGSSGFGGLLVDVGVALRMLSSILGVSG